MQIKIVDDHCRGDVISHIVRTTKKQPRFVVQSKRPDWNNGEKRKAPDEEYKLFASVWTVSSFMEMARQRLCGRAAEETRQWVINCMREMDKSGDPLLMALSLVGLAGCSSGKSNLQPKGVKIQTSVFKSELLSKLDDFATNHRVVKTTDPEDLTDDAVYVSKYVSKENLTYSFPTGKEPTATK